MQWNKYLLFLAFVFATGCETAGDNKVVTEAAAETADLIEGKPTHPEQLNELEWLVGNWKDADKTQEVTFNTRWGHRNKNFLIQHFIVKMEGEDELEGYQMIGWDPINKKIISWIFDSDGGFGSGIWSKEGNSWQVTTDYTLADGGKASSVSIYTPLDENAYDFSSKERVVDGEKLPDIESIRIVRQR